ncbi:MAG TPA: hypothetical protein VM165_06350 [Planctomycetaceae bacterium]|nr:hypothetical protein [Planctomycetaceae bacterium]
MPKDALRSQPALAWWKRWLFRLATVGIALVALELVSWCLWAVAHPQIDWKTVRDMQTTLAESAALSTEGTEAIHPYLGWVVDPQVLRNVEIAGERTPVNELGFVDNATSLVQRQPGTKIVGVVGGSVSLQMTWLSEAAFRDELQRHPLFQGQKIRIVRLAMSGYKQPQQLMSLSYLLALGGEFDYVINIDGFNEIALAVEDNYVGYVNIAYPRLWQHRLADVVDPRTTSVSYRLLASRARRQSLAVWITNSWLRNSATVNYGWYLYDDRLWKHQMRFGDELRAHAVAHGRSFARQGPDNHLPDRQAALRAALDLWEHSSRQLHHLCAGNGIGYLHVLQPNQYHAGSKPLTAQERKDFFAEDERFAQAIRNAYPAAIERGAALRREGIAFVDLTPLFAAETDTIYTDFCCHYNQQGNDLFATAVARALAELAERE